MPDASPTARALRTLELIQGRPGITAEGLAGELGVTERAARRYVGVLREAEIPVESTRGRYGGYRLGRGVRLPPVTFSAAEALALVMAALDGHHEAGDPAGPVGAALGKLVRALPAGVAAQAEVVRRTTAPAPDRSAARPDPTTTAVLVQGCAEHRRIRLTYRSGNGTEWDADVEPWSVVVRHSRWYLLCRTARDEVRAYRVDRVRAATVLDEVFTPPADLDPVALLEENLATGWEYATEVEIDAPLDDVAHWVSPALGRLTAVDERTTRLVGSTSNPWWYAEQLVRTPAPYRVIGCPELRETTRALGRRLLDAAG
ncbi:WYL domain-containing protein [Cellulomonas sp. H30R-01]|uniref:helix-turn-helix transcriptional regulator n=1 Tax=Cellulomonas sp. H30R-01 TaxID=2704467 RepID=UPI00138C47D6|nr:WYL domain-containing protein [Cellulomonas sp. H30R-01]QHT57608.1 WYL domain-containing protein [Cellulomonas sp. H30R-01]